MRNRVSCFMLALLLGLLGALSAQAAGQQNDDYLIERDSINAGGQISTSSAYSLTGSIGQPFAVGRSDNSLHINFSGFWGGGTSLGTSYTLTVEIEGEGRVVGDGIDCEPDCTESYPEGTELSLEAIPEPCWRFMEWRLDGDLISGPIVVDRDITIIAVFEYCCPDAFSLLSPANLASNQRLDVEPAWEAAAGATSYTVSFGSSSPPPELGTVTGTTYDPGTLASGATYYWRIDAVNSCGAVESEEWSFTTTHLPQITSDPPAMVNRTYEYDVDASDPDGDALSFSLSDAPDGMTIDAVSGLIVWTAAPDQIGNFNPTVTVADTRGGTASQTIPLTVTAETFSTMTVAFLEGVNLQDGATEQDNTVLTLGRVKTNMSDVTDIILPTMDKLFSFSTLASFHTEFRSEQAIIVPESTVARIAIEDTASGGKAFSEILATNVTGLTSWTTPGKVAVSDTKSIIFERSDGTYLKTGHFTLNLTEGTLTFAYADVTP